MSYILLRATELARKYGFDVNVLYKADREHHRKSRLGQLRIGERTVVTVEGCPIQFERDTDRRGNTRWLEVAK